MTRMNPAHAIVIGVFLVALMAMASAANATDVTPAPGDGEMIVYIGTSSSPKSQGIYMTRLNPETGALSAPQLAAEAKNANFLALHPSQKFLYACADLTDAAAAAKGGGVAGFAIDPETGKLAALNQQSSGGRGPCYVGVDRTGKNLLVANYASGSIACVPIGDDGRLSAPSAVVQHEGGSGVFEKRQDGPHAHWINVDPANRFVLAADLGLDRIMVYKFDAEKGTLAPNKPPAGFLAPGAGPRHLAWHPNEKIAYVINELGSTVTAFHYDGERGALTELQTVPTLPNDYTGKNTTAEVVVHPNGKFLYGSNRGHDSIALFAIDADGKLIPRDHTPTQGETPRNFAIDPSGQFLLAANQKTDSVIVFRIDQTTGALTPTGSKIDVAAPVCIRFLPATK